MTEKLQIVSIETGEVVKEVDVKGRAESYIEKCFMGMLRNLNHDQYFVREWPQIETDDADTSEK